MRRRRAFTLVELIIALAMTSLIGAVAVPFVVKLLRGMGGTAGVLDAQQSVSTALDFVDHDLRMAGVGAGINQPALVEANVKAVTFNADVVANDTTGEETASYYDPSVPESLAVALVKADKITLPLAAVNYPDSTYWQSAGNVSNAETISFYLAADTSSGAATNTLALWRRVNTGPVTLLARGLDTSSKFQYFVPATYLVPADSTHYDSVLTTQVPVYWGYGTGGLLTHSDSVLSNIDQVSVQLKAVYVDRYGGRHYRSVSEMIPITNSGLSGISGCGSAPTGPASFAATAGTNNTVKVTWTPPTGGESAHLVQNYVVYQRGPYTTVQPTLWSAILNIAANGSATYTQKLPGLHGSGSKYDFAIATQNCTPSLSTLSTVTAVLPTP
jgi:prepilin-type N-terminal cleavage/methylation domain-containing protein